MGGKWNGLLCNRAADQKISESEGAFTRTACRKVWCIGKNRFQMGDRIKYARS